MASNSFKLKALLLILSYTTAVRGIGQCQGYNDQATLTVDGYTYQIHCASGDSNTAFAAQTSDETFEDCAAACNKYSDTHQEEPCVAGVVNSALQGGNACYLKTVAPGLTINAASDILTRVTAFVPGAFCQGKADGTIITDSNGESYQVACNTDIQIGDITQVNVESFAECAAACEDYNKNNPTSPPCNAGVVPSAEGGGSVCHLKAISKPTADSYSYDAILRVTPAQGTCLGKTDGTPFVEGGNTYQVRCFTDIRLVDLANEVLTTSTFEGCADFCNANPDCEGFVITDDNGCHLKAATTNEDFSDKFHAAELLSRGSSSTSTSATSLSSGTGGTSIPIVTAPSGISRSLSFPGTSSRTLSFPGSASSSFSLQTTGISIPISLGTSSSGFSSESTSTTVISADTSASADTSVISTSTDTVSEPSTASSETSESSIITAISTSDSSTTLAPISTSIPESVVSSNLSITILSSSRSLSDTVLTESSTTTSLSSDVTNTASESGGSSDIESSTGVSDASGLSTATTTSLTATTSPTAGSNSPTFAIRIVLQSGIIGTLSPDGTIGIEGTLTAVFQIIDSSLFQVGSEALRRRAIGSIISTEPGSDRQLFAPEVSPGSLKTTFVFNDFVAGLVWNNADFYSGKAGYCVIGNKLYATFVEDVSFCDYVVNPILIPASSDASSTGISGLPSTVATTGNPSATGSSSSTTINGNNNTVTYNNNVYNFNIDINVLGLSGIFNNANYFSDNADTFYAKLCPICPPILVCKSNLTYAQSACPVCEAEIYKLDSVSDVPEGKTGTCKFGQASCLSCNAEKSPPPAAASDLTVVPAHCPVCPDKTTYLACPSSAVASVQKIASASGPAAAQSAAAKAIADSGVTITKTITETAPGEKTSDVAPSTVVNLPCPSCPAGSAAVTLPQVAAAATPATEVPATAAPAPVAEGSAAPSEASKSVGGAGPAVSPIEGFKGAAMSLVKPVVSIFVAFASIAMFNYAL